VQLADGGSLDVLAKEVSLSKVILDACVTCKFPSDKCDNKIRLYINNSCDHSHINFEISSILSVRRKNEPPFPPDNLPEQGTNRLMLWHGTTLVGVQGILQNGFVRPTSTDHLMFGNGIYFADRFSKSAQYCDANKKRRHPAKGTRGYLLLCDVSLGKRYKAYKEKAKATAAVPGFDSFKGQGKYRPDWKDNWDYYGSTMPVGETVQDDQYPDYNLKYSEDIVLDPDAIHIRFVVVVDFN